MVVKTCLVIKHITLALRLEYEYFHISYEFYLLGLRSGVLWMYRMFICIPLEGKFVQQKRRI